MTIHCGLCGYAGPYTATEWFYHLYRRCRPVAGDDNLQQLVALWHRRT